MGQAIEDGVLCDYDITVPALTAHHAYVCLADLLLKQAGRFRRVLAYCNSIAEAKRFRMVLRELGLAAWHINGKTPSHKRQAVMAEFAGPLQKPVHVLVTVEVLGEGINIPNADTCMFVEPRNSYTSIVQAIGRVLRNHPAKTLAHIVLPAVAIPNSRSACVSQSHSRNTEVEDEEQPNAREVDSLQIREPQRRSRTPDKTGRELPTVQVEQRQPKKTRTFGTAEDEAPSRSASTAAISVAGPSAVTRRQADKFNPAIHSNGLQIDQGRPNRKENFDASLLKRKPGSKNCNKSEAQVCPAASTGQQEQLQTIPGSIERRHRHHPAQTPQAEVQDQYLEISKLARCDPTTPGRPGVFAGFGRPIDDQVPTMQKSRATIPTIRRQGFNLKASGGSLMFDQQFSSQVERFLATLMVADHRLVGATAGHRIQVADCTLADAGVGMIQRWTVEILGRLSAILSSEDRWEIRLRNLEAFVHEHGTLPRRQCESHSERALGAWLNAQCAALRKQRLLLHRFQKLLVSLPLIRRRANGWQMKDTDGLFMEKCYELREYVQLHHRLPASGKRAKWLADVRGGNIRLGPDRIKMMQEVHPLVKAEIQKWQNAPRLRRSQWERKCDQLSGFVLAKGRLPKSGGDTKFERSCYNWLGIQCRKLLAGCLPDDLAQRLRNAHPLIAAYIDAFA